MSKHTPGPWKVDKVKSHPWIVTCTDKNLGCQNTLVEVGYKPNAYLIASAPELLEACKFAILFVKSYRKNGQGTVLWNKSDENDFQKMRQAIKKAKGDR